MASSIFDTGTLPIPPSPFDSRERAYKRRSYGSVTCVGNDQFDCGLSYTISFKSNESAKYAQGGALQARGGGRYTPNSHLTSIKTKNQGSGDINDSALWEIEFQYTCYSTAQLNSATNAFMVPGNLLNITIGYDPGSKLTINNARLYDFSWSYNSDDGTYSCTGKALGKNSKAGILNAVTVKPSDVSVSIKDKGDKSQSGHGVIKKLANQGELALGLTRRDGKLTGARIPSTDGRAYAKEDYAILKLQKDAGFWDMTFSLGSADNIIVPMVKIKKVVDYMAENTGVPIEFNKGQFNTGFSLLKSADPMKMCFPGKRGKYGDDNDFSALTGTDGEVSDIYVSFPHLIELEERILNEISKEGQSYTLPTFFNTLFGDLEILSGGAIDCFLTATSTGYAIINRKYDIKKSGYSTINLYSKDSAVKSVNMSSNLDHDMAALAFAGGSGKYPTEFANNLFSGCTRKDTKATKPVEDPAAKLQEKIDDIGKNYKSEIVSDFQSVLREYINSNAKGFAIRYGIDLSITMDGYSGPEFMQKFRVSPMPAAVSGASVYFVVGEIEHTCDGKTWDTSIVGYMMVSV